MLNTIVIDYRSVCGVQRAYPVCNQAHLFAVLCRSKTLQDYDLRIIKELGYEVTELSKDSSEAAVSDERSEERK